MEPTTEPRDELAATLERAHALLTGQFAALTQENIKLGDRLAACEKRLGLGRTGLKREQRRKQRRRNMLDRPTDQGQ